MQIFRFRSRPVCWHSILRNRLHRRIYRQSLEKTRGSTPNEVARKVTTIGDAADDPRSGLATIAAALAKGEAVDIRPQGRRVISEKADLERVDAWRNRRLEFTDTPLPAAIEEFNRLLQDTGRDWNGAAAIRAHQRGVSDRRYRWLRVLPAGSFGREDFGFARAGNAVERGIVIDDPV